MIGGDLAQRRRRRGRPDLGVEQAADQLEIVARGPQGDRDLAAAGGDGQRRLVHHRVVQPLASTGREVDPLDLLDDQALIIAGATRPVC